MALRSKTGAEEQPGSHVCTFCQRRFQKKEHVVRHERTHTAERPFSCSSCRKTYARRDTLQRHMRVHQSVPVESDPVEDDGSSSRDAVDAVGVDGLAVSFATPTPDASQSTTTYQDPSPIGFADVPSATGVATAAGDVHRSPFGPAFDENPLLPNWFNSTDFQLPDDFDLNSFNFSFEPVTLPPFGEDANSHHLHHEGSLDARHVGASGVEHSEPMIPDRSEQWFCYIESPLGHQDFSALRNPASAQQAHDVDDDYRMVVHRQLNKQPIIDAMPSTAFLNRCLRLYIEKFSSLLPVVHLPSFRPTERNAWLVVSMCCIGSQLVGTTEATLYGQRMFENVQRVVLASWLSLLAGTFDGLAVLQSTIVGQTYAILSSKPAHLITAQAFHGPMVFSYQKVVQTLRRLEQTRATTTGVGRRPQPEHDMLRQRIRRIGQALRITDTELALLCHQLPIFRLEGEQPAQSDEEFCPPDLQATRKSRQAQTSIMVSHDHDDIQNSNVSRRRPTLSEYARLAELVSGVAQQRCFGVLTNGGSNVLGLEQNLNDWYRENLARSHLSNGMRLDCFWHAGWLAILCDFNQLEIALGRDGQVSAVEVQQSRQGWTKMDRTLRAVMHAYFIQKILAAVTMSEWPAVHVPRCAYHAGLIFCGVAKFAEASQTFFTTPSSKHILLQAADIDTLAKAGTLTEYDWWTLSQDFNTASKLEEQSFKIVSLLRRIGPWGLSLNLANTLEAVLNESS